MDYEEYLFEPRSRVAGGDVDPVGACYGVYRSVGGRGTSLGFKLSLHSFDLHEKPKATWDGFSSTSTRPTQTPITDVM